MRLVSNSLRAAGLVAAFAAAAQAQTIGCEVGGAGGAVPAAGTGGAGAPLPATPFVSTLNVAALPVGATTVTEVKLLGLTHTFTGDVQWVLTDPSGASYNLFSRLCGGSDFGGDYTIVPQCTGGIDTITCTAVLPTGVYGQNFGAFVSGTGGVTNTPLSLIAAATGTWTLTGYDWAGGDVGILTSWDLCFGNPPAPAAPSTAPTLTAPANAATVTNPVTLTWGAVTCATSYDVDLDGVVTNVAGNSFAAPVLAPGVHTWTVRAKNATGSTAFAASRTFDVPPPPPASVCVANGAAAGPVPAVGTGGGTGTLWPTVFPPTPYVNSYSVTVPPGATQIVKVDVSFSTQHTWIGDLQMVLTDPTGGNHNILHRVGFTTTGSGFACDLNGAYSIYETAGLSWPTVCPASTDIPAGDYDQVFGSWTSGTNGVFNTPLSAIPVSSGTWTLTIYDWVGGDSGVLADWKLCFNVPTGPTSYCTAGTTTNGCNAVISGTANPNAANTTQVTINVANVEGQKQGIYFYGINNTGFTPTLWSPGSTSFLCVKGPTQRAGSQGAGGTINACDGAFSLDWDLFVTNNPTAVGVPFSAGDKIFVQAWFRDPPAPKTTNLTNAIEMTVQP
jgi:subtilisin-like proprotein convertase family protein